MHSVCMVELPKRQHVFDCPPIIFLGACRADPFISADVSLVF